MAWICAGSDRVYFPPEKDDFARFHLRQAFGLGLLSTVCFLLFRLLGSDLFYFSLPSMIVLLVLLILWFMGFKSAMDEKEKAVPFIGEYFQRWFSFR